MKYWVTSALGLAIAGISYLANQPVLSAGVIAGLVLIELNAALHDVESAPAT